MDELFHQELDPHRLPLAVRMRPTSLDQVRGHTALHGADGVLTRIVKAQTPFALVLAGPPGVGKTTIGSLIAAERRATFIPLSATTLGVKDIKELALDGQRRRNVGEMEPVCFIDEIHRLSRTQQDALLKPVEEGYFSLIGATTENPYVALSPALLSRIEVVRLAPLADEVLRALILDAAAMEEASIDDEVTAAIISHANGDARSALGMLQRAIEVANNRGQSHHITSLPSPPESVGIDQSSHYEMTSALIKSMRASDATHAIDWLARLLVAGEDPRFIARRLVIFAAEDVGPDNLATLLYANAALTSAEKIGMPEARIILAAVVLRLTEAPKSRRAIDAIDAAMRNVATTQRATVPEHLRGTIAHIEARYRPPIDGG
ncbi:MAG: AAA family ATPase [Ferrimicrobium sp.]